MTDEPRKPILIKRYGRSRLYHVTAKRYLSLNDLRTWAASGTSFIDTETGKNVTSVVLAFA